MGAVCAVVKSANSADPPFAVQEVKNNSNKSLKAATLNIPFP